MLTVCAGGDGTLPSYAELIGELEHASLLAETLQEEKEADQKLTEVARTIGLQAAGPGEGQRKAKAETGSLTFARRTKESNFFPSPVLPAKASAAVGFRFEEERVLFDFEHSRAKVLRGVTVHR